MFTTCPQCSLNLAVTASDLRLGQGYVRCGRCGDVFNAVPSLSDEAEGDDAPGVTSAPAPDELEISAAAEDADSIQVVEPEPPADPNAATGEVEVLRTGTFETIVLEGDGIMQTEETVAESEVDAQLQALVQRFDAVRELEEASEAALWPASEDSPDTGGDDAEDDLDLNEEPGAGFDLDYAERAAADGPMELGTTTDSEALPTAARQDSAAAASGSDAGAHAFEAAQQDSAAAARQQARWLLGSALLALLLIGQAVHHFRESLVALPWVARPLTSLYKTFHVTLEPRWDLQAYEVRQLGADAVPGETPHIAVRASIRNRAPRSQPPPLLRVVLQDRYGNQIATREVAPLEYLRGAGPPQLAADQRVDADLLLPDPGQTAVGFEIDACLRSAAGVLRCASDPAPH